MHRLFLTLMLAAQAAEFPADPAMPAYTLPEAGAATREEWTATRRAEVLELFRAHVYGRVPPTPAPPSFKVVQEGALDGAATLKRIQVTVRSLTINVSLFVPTRVPRPVPAFLLICNRPLENIDPTRAKKSEFWPVEEAIRRGYAIAAFHVADVDPDEHDGFKNGIHGLLDEGPRGPDAWGTLAAWAWGASRVMDYFMTDDDLAKDRIALIGHSRGGKTALWAGAQDERFALVVSNEAGCGGASLSRRKFKGRESVKAINDRFPHWFCERFKGYNDREETLPVDQHLLLALIAPRAVAIGSAAGDLWADPRGEYLSAVEAGKVYRLFGRAGLATEPMPAIGGAIHGDGVHYHIRAGKHDLTLADWTSYLDFADRAFGSARK